MEIALIFWQILLIKPEGNVYYVLQGGSNFWVCGLNPNDCVTIQMKAADQRFLVGLFIVLYKVALTFES